MCSWIERTNIIKMSIELKAIYKCNSIPIQDSNGVFHRTRSSISKISWEPQKVPYSNSDPEEEEQCWRNQASHLMSNYTIIP